MTKLKTTFTDASGEKAALDIKVTPGISLANAGTFRAAIAGVTRGTIGQFVIVDEQVESAGAVTTPADMDAQREDKLVITYTDNVLGGSFRKEFPTFDRTLLSPGSEQLDITTGPVAALVGQIEAHMLSKFGNAVTVTKAEYVAKAI